MGCFALDKNELLTIESERLLAFYENIRRAIELDSLLAVDVGSFGDGVKRYVEQFREEMDGVVALQPR
jgi:hypothetical protein